MAQQINLLTPILLAPKRYFSALALLQATGLLAAAAALATLWLQHRDRQAERDHQALLARNTAEREQLLAARAGLPAPLDANTQQQQLQALEAGNVQRKALLATLGSEDGRRAVQHHSDLLAAVARSLPEAAWLSELRYSPGRLELAGGTLDTAVLRPWLGQLSAHPLMAGQELAALRVERLGAPGSEATSGAVLDRGGALSQSRLPVWGYRVVSAPAGAASGVTR